MTAYGGRMEARITVPVGGWAVSANAGAGAFTATIPAGSYYYQELLFEFEDQLNAGAGGTWTISANNGEGTATDRVLITNTVTSSITWTSTDLRDVLGFTANLSGADNYTAPNHGIGYWRPDTPKLTPYGDAVWDRFSDLRQTIGPRGGVKTLVGNTFEALEQVRWEMVGNAKAVGPDVVGSWQHFWKIVFTGHHSYIVPGNSVRWYQNADQAGGSTTSDVYLVVPAASTVPPVVVGWTGLYRVEIPLVVKA
jgi:hypothetical protein